MYFCREFIFALYCKEHDKKNSIKITVRKYFKNNNFIH